MGKVQKRKGKIDSHLRYWDWIAIAIVVLFVAIVRVRLLQIPFERDEGEYAYMGQLMLQGTPPYKLACNMKLPGTYIAYAVIMAIFGQTISGVHLGILLVNAATIVMMFLLARRLFGPLAGVVAGATYGILSLSTSFFGQAGHATHFVVLFAIGGMLMLLKAIDSERPAHLFFAGLLLGLAILMKQSGAFFALFAVAYLFWTYIRRRGITWSTRILNPTILLAGVVIPFGFTCLLLWRVGVFNRFWFWTVLYAREYASQVPLSMACSCFKQSIGLVVAPAGLLWAISGLGAIALFWDRNARSKAVFVVGFSICAFLAVCPGFYFRSHYFIQFIPSLALLAGVAVSSFGHIIESYRFPKLIKFVPVLVFIGAFVYTVTVQADTFFKLDPNQVSRAVHGANPFLETVKIADYIKERTIKSDTIVVLGSEPQIYFYSDRHSATSYIYTYSLMEEHMKYALDMQTDMIKDIEQARPKYLVLVNILVSWVPKPTSEKKIFDWMVPYIRSHYVQVGVVDMLSPEYTEYVWGDDALYYEPQSLNLIVYMRKD